MKYDVVVVGAGPAGSTAAKGLAEKGVSVLLLDKAKFPRDKPCGGGLPTHVDQRFSYIEPLIDARSYGSAMYSSSLRYHHQLLRDTPFLSTVLRKDFDAGLVEIAIRAGADFQDEHPVIDVSIRKNSAVLTLENGQTIETKAVIGCDGTRSIVAEKTGLAQTQEMFCLALVQEHPMTPKQLDLFFTKKRLLYLYIKTQGIAGYGWIFPKKDCVNVGLGEFQSAVRKNTSNPSLKETYISFISLLKEQKRLPMDFPADQAKGAMLPIFPLQRTYQDRVVLCGDAAGFINPITGEGIYYAMVSGLLAAGVIEEGLKADDLSSRFLSEYQRRWSHEFGKDLRQLGRFNKQWGRDSEVVVRLMMRDSTFAKMVLGIMGGQLGFSKYKYGLLLRFLYVSLLDKVKK